MKKQKSKSGVKLREINVLPYKDIAKIGFIVSLLCGVSAASLEKAYAQTVPNAAGSLMLDGNSVSGNLAANGGSFDVSPNGSSVGSLAGAANGTLDGTLNLTNANDTYSGILSGSGGLTVASTNGTETLSNANTYDGETAINSGILALTGAGSVSQSAGVQVNQGGNFDVSQVNGDAASIQSLSGAGDVTLDDKNLIITNGNNKAGNEYSGKASGDGGITITSGSETLSGSNLYQGATTVNKSADLTLSGSIMGEGLVVDQGGNATIQPSGMVIGKVRNDGTLTTQGTISDTITNTGKLVANGAPFIGEVDNSGNATLTAGWSLGVNNSGTLSASGGLITSVDNSGAATLTNSNEVLGNVTNAAGNLMLDGNIIDKTLAANSGSFEVSSKGSTVGSLSGSASGQLDENGILSLTNANDTYSGVLSGAGGLTVSGGTETLTGANTYTGATTISGGTLALGGAGSIAPSAGVHDNAAFDISGVTPGSSSIQSLDGTGSVALGGKTLDITNGNATFGNTYSGVASGTGGVTVSGGTETLSGANTYTGDTTIRGGTLQLGDGGTTGSLSSTSAIHDDGQLIIDHDNTLAMTQTIDGTGSFTQAGKGRTILSGVNTYSGGTAISGGTLVGTTSSFGSGSIVDNAALVVSQDTSGALANALSGNGAFTKSGTGTVMIDWDDSPFTGTTDISAGTLDVDGSRASSAVTVDHGGTLSGTGTVGSTNVAAGGILSPAGNDVIGTLNVNGTLNMATGSVLAADGNGIMTGAGLSVDNQSYQQLTSDMVKVSGAAVLSGGTVDFHVTDGTALKYGEAYTLVSAAGGVSGRYTNLSTNIVNDYTFMSPTLVYTADNVDLLMQRNGTSFSEAGNTRNERETGHGLDDLPDTSSVVKAMEQLNGNSARRGLDALSGEMHASARTALIQDSFFTRQAALDRLASADCDGAVDSTIRTADLKHQRRTDGHCYSDRAVMWGEAFGSLGSNSGDGNAASMHHSSSGFIMGADAPVFDTWRVGGLVSYGRSMFDVGRGRGSSGRSNNVTIGGYAGTHWGNLNLRLGATYTWDMISIRRNVAFQGFQNRLNSAYLGGTAQGFGELGYKFRMGKTTIEPFGNVAYVNLHTDGFEEHGGAAALRGRGIDTGVTFSTFGVRMASTFQAGKFLLTPHATLGYRHAFGLTVPTTHELFAAANSGNMDISGVPLSTDAAVIDTGLSAKVSNRIDIGISYVGQYGNQSVDSGARAHFRLKF